MSGKRKLLFGIVVIVFTLFFPMAKSFEIGGKNLESNEIVEIEGELEVVFTENFEEATLGVDYYLSDSVAERKLIFEEDAPEIESGNIRVRGFYRADDFVVRDYDLIQEGSNLRGGNGNVLGEKRVAVVLLNFQDNTVEPISVQEVEEKYFDGLRQNSPQSWVQEVSYGQTWLSGDVYGWITLPYNQSTQYCALAGFRNLALPIIDPYIDFTQYEIITFIVPRGVCTFGGVGTIGSSVRQTQEGPISLSFNYLNGPENILNGVATHELGHNFGLFHANDLECQEVAYRQTNCQSIEYGDFFDIMGAHLNLAHFNLVKKELLGWVNPAQILVDPAPGYYQINKIENSEGLKGLKFVLNDLKGMYLEYRRPVGYDSLFTGLQGGHLLDGLLVHTNHVITFGDSQLLDMTPASNSTSQYYDSFSAALPLGNSYYNFDESIYFETVELTDEYAKVRVGRPICGDGIMDAHKGEQCDGNDFGGTSCVDFSSLGPNGLVYYDGGDMACRSDCTFDTNQCVIRESCPWDQDGNGFVNPADRGFVSVQIGCQVGRGNPLCDLADVNDDGFVTAGDRGFIAANIGMCS